MKWNFIFCPSNSLYYVLHAIYFCRPTGGFFPETIFFGPGTYTYGYHGSVYAWAPWNHVPDVAWVKLNLSPDIAWWDERCRTIACSKSNEIILGKIPPFPSKMICYGRKCTKSLSTVFCQPYGWMPQRNKSQSISPFYTNTIMESSTKQSIYSSFFVECWFYCYSINISVILYAVFQIVSF